MAHRVSDIDVGLLAMGAESSGLDYPHVSKERKLSYELALDLRDARAEVADLREDAERFRWATDHPNRWSADGELGSPKFYEEWSPWREFTTLEALIDTLRAEPSEEKTDGD